MPSVAPINHAASAIAANLAVAGKTAALKNLPEAEQVKAAAGQFEAIILRQLLQDSMSKLAGGEKSGGGMYSYLMTDVMANKLTEGGGMGLAKVFARQLSRPVTSQAWTTEVAGKAAAAADEQGTP